MSAAFLYVAFCETIVMNRVLVPLAVKLEADSPKSAMHMARAPYIHQLVSQNLLPVFVSPLFAQDMVAELYEQCSGVLFMGGDDINPEQYGAERHASTKPGDGGRDALEIALAKRAVEDRKPVLGICRGCQVLAVSAGGTLHQHVPDITTAEQHDVVQDLPYDRKMRSRFHAVNVHRDTHAYKVVGKQRIEANSGHHQAVNDPGEYFTVAAETEEEITEIIEHTDSTYFCFGIQSHPEFFTHGDLQPFFPGFAAAVKAYAKR